MVNQTILNNSLSNSTPNEIFIGLLPKSPESSLFSDSNIFWIAAIVSFILIYLSLGFFPSITRSMRVLLSLAVPILLDIALSFGSFIFIFPFGYSFTITNGVMFTKLIDYIFTYGLYTDYSNALLHPYILTASSEPSSIIVYLITLLSTGIDSILEFAFLSYATYMIISVIENSWHKQIKHQLPISLAVGAIPTLYYMIFISNPLLEANDMIINLNGTLNFFSNAPLTDKFIAFFFIIVNFAIIMEIIYLITELIFSLYTKMNYSGESIKWSYNMQGIALMYAFIYSLIYLLHSDFKWYIVFPILLGYSYFKNKTTNYVRTAKASMNDTQRITDITRSTIEGYRSPTPQREVVHDEFSSPNLVISILLIISIILIYLYFTL